LRDLSVAGWWPLLLGIAIALGASLSAPDLGSALVGPALGLGLTLPLLALSLRHFTRSGPGLDAAQLAPHRRLIALSVLRLCLWCVAIFWVLSALGSLVLSGLALLLDWRPGAALHALAGLLGVLCLVGFRFVHTLLHNPGLLVASFSYRVSRLYPLWFKLDAAWLRSVALASRVSLGLLAGGVLVKLWLAQATPPTLGLATLALGLLGLRQWPAAKLAASPARGPDGAPPAALNVIMIGCDTLRADRVFDHPELTPEIAALRAHGVSFTDCHTPCARTAPSLMSLFTGCGPVRHGVRDNFLTADAPPTAAHALPARLRAAGYRTVAVSDWCGADFGKFGFGFETLDLPPDQWNLRYLIRQGPKTLRLFLSLFTQGEWGRRWLPEIHYLGGVPSTSTLVARTAAHLEQLAAQPAPFLLNLFLSTAHPPFASEYPWYVRHSDPAYRGPSKFALARLTDPAEILRRQAEPESAFDLAQIQGLYDGCVAQFDHAVGQVVAQLRALGLLERSLLVIYADHGTDFFEHESWGQGNSVVSDRSSRIPLIVCDPRRPQASQFDQSVSALDLTPTLLDLLGQPVPAGLDGRSLRPWFDAPQDLPPCPVYTETGFWLTDVPGMLAEHLRYPAITELLEVATAAVPMLVVKPRYRQRVIAAKDRALLCEGWKLVWQPLVQGVKLSLFDTRHDPDCRRDCASTEPARVASLLAQLAPYLLADGVAPTPTAAT